LHSALFHNVAGCVGHLPMVYNHREPVMPYKHVGLGRCLFVIVLCLIHS
jgi:hypothetical protein